MPSICSLQRGGDAMSDYEIIHIIIEIIAVIISSNLLLLALLSFIRKKESKIIAPSCLHQDGTPIKR